VHVHILPRKPGDFQKSDDVYEKVLSSISVTKAHLVTSCMSLDVVYKTLQNRLISSQFWVSVEDLLLHF